MATKPTKGIKEYIFHSADWTYDEIKRLDKRLVKYLDKLGKNMQVPLLDIGLAFWLNEQLLTTYDGIANKGGWIFQKGNNKGFFED